MRITKETDYALRIMAILASNNGIADAKTIADEAGVPPRFSLKILRKLMSFGLVKSYKGANGGYTLDKSPDNITLKQVVEAIEGPITISLCLSEGFECSHSEGLKTSCYFYHVFDDINGMIAEKLSGITMQSVIDGAQRCAPKDTTQ